MNPIFKLAQDLKNAEGVSIAAIIKQIEALKKVDSMTAKELEKHVKALVALKKAVDDIPLTEEVTKLQEAISAATERVTTSLESKIATTKAELSKDINATETKLRKEIENRIPDIVTVTEKVTEVAKALDDAEIRKVLDKAIEPEFVKKVRDVIEGFEGEERMDASKLKNLPQMQVLSQTAGGGSNLSVFSNGTFVSSSTRLNFVGATVTDEGGRTKVTITGGSGSGDMTAAVYDPQAIAADAFDRANHTGAQAISTITGLQTALDGKQAIPVVVSGSLTAANDTRYINVASATYTDPTPVEGKGFIVFVRNGTATVGGTGYSTAGTIVHRVYHSGAWANYVYLVEGTFARLAGSVSQSFGASTVELGHASDTTISRVSAGVAAVEGDTILTANAFNAAERGKRTIAVLINDSTALTTGDGKIAVPVDTTINGMNVVAVKAYVGTVSSSGSVTVAIRRSRRSSATARTVVDILSTNITIEASEFESADATTAPVINTSNDDLQTGDMLFFDVDAAGTGVAYLQALVTCQLP